MALYRVCFAVGLAVLAASMLAGFGRVLATEHQLPGLSRDPFLVAQRDLAHGREQAAAREYRTGAAVNRADFSIQLSAADGLARAHDLQGALATLDHAETLRPGDVRTQNTRGRAYLANGRLQEAFTTFGEALRRAPGDADAMAGVGEVMLAQGRFPEAETAFRRALQARPGDAALHDALAVTLAGAGRHAEAAGEFEQAMALGPSPDRAANLARARREAAAKP